MPQAILFGSIGVIAETADIQRKAFNLAFEEADLEWHWDTDEYAKLLRSSGGKKRIADYASDRGEEVDAEGIHSRKTEIFGKMLKDGVSPRPGVLDVIDAAKDSDVPLAFVTTTSSDNVRNILDATGISPKTFAFIGHRDLVRIGKPSAEIYRLALEQLGIAASNAVAIEDSAPSIRAAVAAEIPALAFPGKMHLNDDFADAFDRTERLTPRLLGLDRAERAA